MLFTVYIIWTFHILPTITGAFNHGLSQYHKSVATVTIFCFRIVLLPLKQRNGERKKMNATWHLM